MNAVKLIGNVGKEVNIKDLGNNKIASFSLATNEVYKEKTNTTWHNIIAWGKVADQCEKLLSKGKFITLEGKIQYRQYQNKEDKTVYVTEIVAYKVEEFKKEN